jgi:hypothetical protein
MENRRAAGRTSAINMKLVFVYNADSGMLNTLVDIAHKILSPKTYNCNLCMLTHGYFSARKNWLDFLQTLNIEMEFLHRDELIKHHPDSSDALPAIFIEHDKFDLLISADEIHALQSVEALQDLIKKKIKYFVNASNII